MLDRTIILVSIVAIFLAISVMIFPLVQRRTVRCFTMALGGVVVAGLYVYFGGIVGYRHYLGHLEGQEKVRTLLQTNPGREKLIQAIKEKLKVESKSAQGWYLLGRLHLGENNWSLAQQAFEQAVLYEPDNDAYQVNLAQSYWQLNQQKFNNSIRGRFQRVLELNPKQANGLAMLALDSYQQQQYTKAIQYWKTLLTVLPPSSKDALAVKKALASAQDKLLH